MNIKEISRLCGVSVFTVSRVLNGRAAEFRISAATAKRVMDMAEKVQYRPNYLAHSLNTDRTYSVGVIFANTVDNYLGSIMEGVEAHLRGTEYQTAVETGENDIRLQDQALRRMLHRRADGIIFYPVALPPGKRYELPTPNDQRKHQVPIVIIGRTIPGARDQIMMGDFEAGAATANRFLEAGCKRFAFLTNPVNCSSDHARQKGFIQTLKQAGIPAANRIVVAEQGGPASESLHKLRRADALFGVNSGLLLAYVRRLRALADVRHMHMVSVGDIEGAELMDLKLWTWSTPGRRMGEEAARAVLSRIDDPAAPWKNVVVPLEWTTA
ncbi:MAG: LacI family transcriptional regulator [Lentisphaerae bacterium]|nr:LacI family transcriptional regulator [Lentisphaerota bacterium]